jgi:hypothetical protein
VCKLAQCVGKEEKVVRSSTATNVQSGMTIVETKRLETLARCAMVSGCASVVTGVWLIGKVVVGW